MTTTKTTSTKPTNTKKVSTPASKKHTTKPTTNLAGDLVKASSKVPEVKKPLIKKAEHTLYAPIITTPKGKALFAYTDAVMTALGMTGVKREGVPQGAFTAFRGMGKALAYHGKLKRIEKTGKGLIRLTTAGLTFFTSRKAKNNLDQKAIDKMIKVMTSGKASTAKDHPFKGLRLSKVEY